MGYPVWALDRVRDTIADWPAADVSVLLAAHQQFLGLVMAQVAEIAQQRIARARDEENERRSEGDDTSLMQASPAEGGISTYGLELQFLTDEFAAMTADVARVRSSLLRGLLAKRYGCSAGRLAMRPRAMALEAAVVAYDDENSAVESECPEQAEDRNWCAKWWKRLLGPIVEEERQLRAARERAVAASVPETVEESGEDEPTQLLGAVEEKCGDLKLEEELDVLLQDELEIQRVREEEAMQQSRYEAMLNRQLLEYEQERERERHDDEARWEELQAQYAQEWDDWVMWRSLRGAQPGRERPICRFRESFGGA